MAAFHGCSRWLVGALVAATATAQAGRAAADEVDTRLAGYETELRRLGANLPRPNQLSLEAGQRRLVDAQIAFALGDYDGAAVLLFELAARPGPDHETAVFYLAESLYHKADRGAARSYYAQLVAAGNVASKYYQPALLRQIEIAIAQRDQASAAAAVDKLDRVNPALHTPAVPYIRGKLAYSQGKLDEALGFFQQVPRRSAYELQAAYFTATAHVVKKDLQRATDLFTELIARKPASPNDRRVIELSQLALGRLYYERDQPSKSIDSYLLVDRHSDLFPDALYEVGWVYVKNKQYDKALRALELLSQSDPQSTKTPTVRILEGNLRVRKAQMIRAAQIQGTLDNRSTDSPAAEYDKAAKIFSETHGAYVPSYAALSAIVDSKADPGQYLMQIAGRSEHVFQTTAPLPEAAVQYLREEPEIQHVVAVATDLGDITTNLDIVESTIARLEGVLAAGDSSGVYPALANRRARLTGIEGELIKLRSALADQQLAVLGNQGATAAATQTRRQRIAAFQAQPSPEQAANEQLTRRMADYDRIEATVLEVAAAIGATQATAVALRKYVGDRPELAADQKRTTLGALDEAGREAHAIERELASARRELQLGRDLAALGDESTAAARTSRKQLKAAEDDEHRALAQQASSSRDPRASQRLAAQADRAARLADQVEQTSQQLDAMVDQGMREIRGLVTEAKATLEAYRAELTSHETEARALGGELLGATFQDVKAKLYDIVVRTDVGSVDVAWSQKEDTDDDLKRLNLSRQRELKQLRDEFKDILDAGTQKPSQPAEPAEVAEPPRSEPSPPTGSPDQEGKGSEERVPPGGERTNAPPAPTVKPDAAKDLAAPQAGARKPAPRAKGASR